MSFYNEKAECMPREQLEALQSERLVKQIKRVYNNQPVYRAKMDEAGIKPEDIKSIKDIVKLPFTVKHDIREGYPYGMFACDMKDVLRIHASSGTTGKLTVVGYTQNDLDTWTECCARALVRADLGEGDIMNVAYGYGLFTGGLGMHYGGEKMGATVVPMSSGNTPRQLMLMKDFGTTAIACTPSYAIYLADEMKKEGYKPEDIKLKAGIFGAEPWSEEMRNEIQRKMGIKAYDIYGLSEISAQASHLNAL
jgi:phenylacetate-CoA ligase